MVELADIDRKIRLAQRVLNQLEGEGHIEHVVKTMNKTLLDIMADLNEVLQDHEEGLDNLNRATPRSS